MCLVTTPERAVELGLTPLVRPGVLGPSRLCHPNVMGIGPVPATELALGQGRACNWSDIDLIELNEAFAAAGTCRDAGVGLWRRRPGADQRARLGVSHWAIQSARPAAECWPRLARELNRRGARYGLETMCIGGRTRPRRGFSSESGRS